MIEPLTLREATGTADRSITTREFFVRAATIDEDARSVEATLSTEQPTTVFDWGRWESIDEVLIARGVKMPDTKQVPLLETHARHSLDTILGSVRDIRADDGEVVGRLVLADGDERAESAWSKIRQGHLTDVSVGYTVYDWIDIPPGKSQRVAGKDYAAGERALRVVKEWRLRETSLVPVGADSSAKIREAEADRLNLKEKQMDQELRRYLESLGLRADSTDAEAFAFRDALAPERRAEADAAERGEQVEKESARSHAVENNTVVADDKSDGFQLESFDKDAIRADAIKAERERATQIRAASVDGVPSEVVTKAIDDGLTVDQSRAIFLDSLRSGRGPAASVHTRNHEEGNELLVLAESVAQRANTTLVDKDATDDVRRNQERIANMAQRHEGLSLVDMCRESLRATGRTPERNRLEMIRTAMSTTAITTVLTPTANASIQMAWDSARDNTMWAKEVDVKDFTSQTLIDVGDNDDLEIVRPGGTAVDTALSETTDSFRIHRYGQKFVMDEQHIINDQFSVIMDTPARHGAAAMRLKQDAVWALLMSNPTMRDSVACFHADHGNYNAAAGGDFDATTLAEAIAAMAIQTNASGSSLNIQPAYLLIPPALVNSAKILLHSAETASTDGTINPFLDYNIQFVSEARLANGTKLPATDTTTKPTAVAGSSIKWWLAASPTDGPGMQIAYLEGTGRRPVIRSSTLQDGSGQWGVQFDVKLDVGTKIVDWRGLWHSLGTD